MQKFNAWLDRWIDQVLLVATLILCAWLAYLAVGLALDGQKILDPATPTGAPLRTPSRLPVPTPTAYHALSFTPTPTTWPINEFFDPTDFYFNTQPYPLMKQPAEWTVSLDGLQFSEFWEGYIAQKYNDGNQLSDPGFYAVDGSGVGNCTIGFGHLLHLGPCDGSEGFGGGMTRVDAEELLLEELDHCGRYLPDYVTVPLSQAQYNILAGLVCGWGYQPFSRSKLLPLLNRGLYVEAADALRTTAIYGIGGSGVYPGLSRRRSIEADRFVQPIGTKLWPLPTPTPAPVPTPNARGM